MSFYSAWTQAGWRAHLPTGANSVEVARKLGAAPIPALAAESARRVPDRVAFTVDGEPVTHGALAAAAGQVAGWLAGRIVPGDRVLLAAGTSPGFLRCYLGALTAGAMVVLASPRYTEAELGHLVADSGARLAFTDPEPARRLAALGGREPLLVLPAGEPGAWPGWPGQAGPGPLAPAVRPEDPAVLAYTSGTTGRPKGVPLTHRNLAASTQAAMAAWRWSGDDVLVHALPLFHQHGLHGVHATLIAGSAAHLLATFDPAGLIETARRGHATLLFGVPATYQALLDHQDHLGPADQPLLGVLRLAVCGSAPLSPALAADLPRLLGRLPLIRYGTTESGLDVSNTLGHPRPDTLGVPLPGVACRVWAGDAAAEPAREAPPGADGEIQVRGPQVFGGYWRDPAATAAAFTADGWFRTGDIGAVDPASGHLLIRGRSKELIITGGLNVYPREVELALETHPAVAQAGVAGVPHRRWGEQVTAWVVLRPGAEISEADLIAHARTRVAPYKSPKQIFRVTGLPRTSIGKLDRRALHPPEAPAG